MAGLAAIQYKPSAFDLRVAKMMGRQVAGQTFLQAWVDYSGADPLTCWGDSVADCRAFSDHVREMGASVPIAHASFQNMVALKSTGALWLGDPQIARRSWYRRWYGQRAWSIVGITHTISTHSAMQVIGDMLHDPVQEWDALICTSQAAQDAVRAMLKAKAEYLNARLGAQNFTLPKLPVIPLGIPCAALDRDDAARRRWREKLGIADDAVAVLQFGRLAIHGKAHPAPLFLALAEAGRRLGRPLHLILAGQFPNPGQEEDCRNMAAAMGDAVMTHFVDGALPDVGEVRSAADIGTLLSDNIQETFGLAPVELMAARLPVVASDWDGLRDTIDHGVTGFRIETLIPPAGVGEYLALRYGTIDDYDVYLSGVMQSVAVDIAQAADAFETLARDRSLRLRMGDAARRRALDKFDWPVVIGAYRELLTELAAIRSGPARDVAPHVPGTQFNPTAMDPFVAFAGYASGMVSEDMLLIAAPGRPASIHDVIGGLAMTRLHGPALPAIDEMETMAGGLGHEPISAGALCDLVPEVSRGPAMAAIGWLLKFGFAIRA